LGGETSGDDGTGVLATTLAVFGLLVAFFFKAAGVLGFLAAGIAATVAFLAGVVATVVFFFSVKLYLFGGTPLHLLSSK
jgi:hypothetical protein